MVVKGLVLIFAVGFDSLQNSGVLTKA
jgi:ABC-type xylose transport system permease subunit